MIHRFKCLAPLLVMFIVMLVPGHAYCGALFNQAPVISDIIVRKKRVAPLENVQLKCIAVDRDRDVLMYDWSADGGIIDGNGLSVVWKAPKTPGTYTITARVKDGKGGEAVSQVIIDVLSKSNNAPIIDDLSVRPKVIFEGKSTTVICDAMDPDGDALTYHWEVKSGRIVGEGSKVTWIAPMEEREFVIFCYVTDSNGNKSRPSSVTVKVICDCEGGKKSDY